MRAGMSLAERQAQRKAYLDTAVAEATARAALMSMSMRCAGLQDAPGNPGHRLCRGEDPGNPGCLCRCHDPGAEIIASSHERSP